MLYSDLSLLSVTTERYRLWYRIEHYESSEEDRTHEQTAGLGDRDTDDRSSGGRLQRQRTDDLPGDPEWEAQSLPAQQRLSDQTRRFADLVRGISGQRERQGGDERLVTNGVSLR